MEFIPEFFPYRVIELSTGGFHIVLVGWHDEGKKIELTCGSYGI